MQQNISWYPGHMAKSRRLLAEQLKRVDAVIELSDARLPLSSRNPDLHRMAENKPVLLLLSKADLASPDMTGRWLAYFKGIGTPAVPLRMEKDRKQVLAALEGLTAGTIRRFAGKGLTRPARAMVVGVPNVGKSTLINLLAGRSAFRVEDRPGVTRTPQWIFASPGLQLLDTPGLLWPRLDDQTAARRLAYLGAVRDEVLDVYNLSLQLLDELMALKPSGVLDRYGISDPLLRGTDLLTAVCSSRGFLLRGGAADLERGAICVLDEFRAGMLGRITLEEPPAVEHAEARGL